MGVVNSLKRLESSAKARLSRVRKKFSRTKNTTGVKDKSEEVNAKPEEVDAEIEDSVEQREIVVSLRKLKEYIKENGTKNDLFKDLKEIVTETNTNEAKKSIVEFVNEKFSNLEETKYIQEKVLIFSLISFYFRNGSKPHRATNVKFSKKDSKLLTKTNDWIVKNTDGNNKSECQKAMGKLFDSVKNIKKGQWGKTGDLIAAISADKVGSAIRMLRKKKNKFKKEAEERARKGEIPEGAVETSNGNESSGAAIKEESEEYKKGRGRQEPPETQMQVRKEDEIPEPQSSEEELGVNQTDQTLEGWQARQEDEIPEGAVETSNGDGNSGADALTENDGAAITEDDKTALRHQRIVKKREETKAEIISAWNSKGTIKKIRIVGDALDQKKEDRRYVISKKGEELIIYPSFAGEDVTLGYVVNHLYKIASYSDRRYPGEPLLTDKVYDNINNLDEDELVAIITAFEEGFVVSWEEFLKKDLGFFYDACFLDSKGDLIYVSTYGEAIEAEGKSWTDASKKLEKDRTESAQKLFEFTSQSSEYAKEKISEKEKEIEISMGKLNCWRQFATYENGQLKFKDPQALKNYNQELKFCQQLIKKHRRWELLLEIKNAMESEKDYYEVLKLFKKCVFDFYDFNYKDDTELKEQVIALKNLMYDQRTDKLNQMARDIVQGAEKVKTVTVEEMRRQAEKVTPTELKKTSDGGALYNLYLTEILNDPELKLISEKSFIPGQELLQRHNEALADREYDPNNDVLHLCGTASQTNGLESVNTKHSPLYYQLCDRTQGPTQNSESVEGTLQREVMYENGELKEFDIAKLLIEKLCEKEVITCVCDYNSNKLDIGTWISTDGYYNCGVQIQKQDPVAGTGKYAFYRNGYIQPMTLNSLGELKLMEAIASAPCSYMSQDNTSNDGKQKFTQNFAAAFSYQGCKIIEFSAQQIMMNLMWIYPQYDNIIKDAIIKSAKHPEKKIVIVHMPEIGQGAFGNPKGLTGLALILAIIVNIQKLSGSNIIFQRESGSAISGEAVNNVEKLYGTLDENATPVKYYADKLDENLIGALGAYRSFKHLITKRAIAFGYLGKDGKYVPPRAQYPPQGPLNQQYGQQYR